MGRYSYSQPSSSSHSPDLTSLLEAEVYNIAHVGSFLHVSLPPQKPLPLCLLKNPGLTIYHVKSHLQKYRAARYKPETSEATGETQEKKITSIEDIKSLDMKTSVEITQALRLQMEVQKRLHEQLEIQRYLQLQIEKQGRQLQMMFEKQQKLQENKSSSSELSPKQCNGTSAEVEFGLEAQAVNQTEPASSSRKRTRED
ncbi:hypothetical protein F2Q68_00018796 [Brassica cretica]|uniref:MYB-CC type transcription factor LHEQLE-containing domain-containing protein n=1 Tax=Brassica cretica TaxID=69181 RepID=A0A8S9FUY6_BRACR|nr:hypothetical protein F2Q68_00018796 [Brassica cretica]